MAPAASVGPSMPSVPIDTSTARPAAAASRAASGEGELLIAAAAAAAATRTVVSPLEITASGRRPAAAGRHRVPPAPRAARAASPTTGRIVHDLA